MPKNSHGSSTSCPAEQEQVMRLGYRLAAALGAGVLLLGAAGVISLATDPAAFYWICGWIWGVLLILAFFVQVGMVSAKTKWVLRDGREHSYREDLRTPTAGVSVTERRWARLGSLYLVLAALPCLVVAASNYFE